MAAVVQQSPNGVAFEVAIKKPEAAHAMTPVRARLERYAAGAKPLPRLLGASGRPRDSDSPRTPPKAVAERARAQNERKQAVLEKKRREDGERLDALRRSLEEDLGKAEQKRRSSLADTSLKAGEHFGKVKAKLSEVQQQIADAAAVHQRKLDEMLGRKGAAHDAGMTERGEKAGKHNEQVAKQLAQYQKQQADATAEQQRKFAEILAQKGLAHKAGIAERGEKAGKHNEQVAKQLAQHQKQQATTMAEQQRKIAEDLAQKGAAHHAGIAERGEKASKHNEQVAEKVQQHQQDLLQRTDKLREHIREKLEREKPDRRALFSGFSPPVSPNGAVVGTAVAK